jgi:hypothetical protein
MNDEFDSLEAELAALQPRQPSTGLERQIAAELEQSPARRQRTLVVGALAAGAIAAGLLAAVWLWRGDRGMAKVQPQAPLEPPPAMAFDPALPSVWSFRPACVQSADELNALLDRHAGRIPAQRTHYVQIRGFGVSETERNEALGEL